MNARLRRKLSRRKCRIARRLEHLPSAERCEPMMAAANIRDEIAEKVQGIAPGGIGAMQLLAHKLGLIEDIDRHLRLHRIPGRYPPGPNLDGNDWQGVSAS